MDVAIQNGKLVARGACLAVARNEILLPLGLKSALSEWKSTSSSISSPSLDTGCADDERGGQELLWLTMDLENARHITACLRPPVFLFPASGIRVSSPYSAVNRSNACIARSEPGMQSRWPCYFQYLSVPDRKGQIARGNDIWIVLNRVHGAIWCVGETVMSMAGLVLESA